MRLRNLALQWLRADLDQWRKVLDHEDSSQAELARTAIMHCLVCPDLTCVRDKSMVARLPPDEQRKWRQFWTETADLKVQLDTSPFR
jgi:hypothetical protein